MHDQSMCMSDESFEALRAQLAVAAGSTDDARLAGGSLGHALVETSLSASQLGDLRHGMTRNAGDANEFVDGYLSALSDILSAAERSTVVALNRQDAKALLARPIARAIVLALSDNPMGPVKLALAIHRDQSQVSHELAKLEDKGLIDVCAAHDRKSRPRELSPLGHVMVVQLKKEIEASERHSVDVSGQSRGVRFKLGPIVTRRLANAIQVVQAGNADASDFQNWASIKKTFRVTALGKIVNVEPGAPEKSRVVGCAALRRRRPGSKIFEIGDLHRSRLK